MEIIVNCSIIIAIIVNEITALVGLTYFVVYDHDPR